MCQTEPIFTDFDVIMETMHGNQFVCDTFAVGHKSVLITGASSGFGEHFAWTFAKAGCTKIAILARRLDRLEQLAEQVMRKFPQCVVAPVACDITKVESIKKAFDQAEELAQTKFDVIINNAGLGMTRSVLKVDEEVFDQHVNINLRGSWFVAQEAAKRMIDAKIKGSIINIASIYGLRVGIGHGVYSVTKAGLTQMTKAMAIEFLRYGIRVNSINPGYFRTEMTKDFYDGPKGQQFLKEHTPLNRLGLLEELDGALLLLASDASRFMYGSVIVVDGGHVISSL